MPYVLAPAIKSIVAQQVDPRIAADLKAFDFHKVVDNSIVERLVKEGYFEQLFGADVKAEEQRESEAGVLKRPITKTRRHEEHEDSTCRVTARV